MRKKVWLVAIGCAAICLVGSFTSAQEPVHWDVFEQILDEAFERSEVMSNAGWLTDVYGPRNSKSSGYVAASKWARQKLEDYRALERPVGAVRVRSRLGEPVLVVPHGRSDVHAHHRLPRGLVGGHRGEDPTAGGVPPASLRCAGSPTLAGLGGTDSRRPGRHLCRPIGGPLV